MKRFLFNKKTQYSLSGVVATALVTLFATQVCAQSWTVGPLNGKLRRPQCTMKKTYENGHTLVFARDVSGGNTLAVDFGQSLFETGQRYVMTMEIDTLSRQMTSMAATPHVLLLAMGGDAPFYEMIASKKSLDLSVQDHKNTYSLQGTRDALDALGECADILSVERGLLSQPITVTENVPFRPVIKVHMPDETLGGRFIVSDEVAQLRADNNLLKQEIESLKKKTYKKIIPEYKENKAYARPKVVFLDKKVKKESKERVVAAFMKDPDVVEKKTDVAENIPTPTIEKVKNPKTVDVTDSAPAIAEGIQIAKDDKLGQALLRSRVVLQTELTLQLEDGVWVYSWQANGLQGRAEEKKVGQTVKTFDAMRQVYFEEQSSHCAGDFAHMAGEKEVYNGVTVQKAELACIGEDTEKAAAVLFVTSSLSTGFSVVSHEGLSAKVGRAIEMRDAVAQAFYTVKD